MKLQLLFFLMYVVGYGLLYLALSAFNPSLIVWIIAFVIAYSILTSIQKIITLKQTN